MDKKKLFLIVSLIFVAAAVALGWYFADRALNCKKAKNLSDKDYTRIEVRQENDKRFKNAKKYFENSDLSKPTLETARNAAYLADAGLLETIYKNDLARGEKKEIKWDDQQIFIYASYYGTPAVIEQLTAYKKAAEVNGGTKERKAKKGEITVLHYAAVAGNMTLVKYYGDSGMDLQSVDARGWNLLHFAAAGGNPDVVKYLVEAKGFDVNAKNHYGQTALDYAKTRAVADYLKAKGAKSGSQMR